MKKTIGLFVLLLGLVHCGNQVDDVFVIRRDVAEKAHELARGVKMAQKSIEENLPPNVKLPVCHSSEECGQQQVQFKDLEANELRAANSATNDGDKAQHAYFAVFYGNMANYSGLQEEYETVKELIVAPSAEADKKHD